MRYKDFVKSTEDIFEAIVKNAGITSLAISELKDQVKKLKRENKLLREYLSVEIVEETVEEGLTNKIIRKSK